MAVLIRLLGLRRAELWPTDNEGRRSMPPGILLVNAQSGRERPRPPNRAAFPMSPYGVAHVLTACAEGASNRAAKCRAKSRDQEFAVCERSRVCL